MSSISAESRRNAVHGAMNVFAVFAVCAVSLLTSDVHRTASKLPQFYQTSAFFLSRNETGQKVVSCRAVQTGKFAIVSNVKKNQRSMTKNTT